MQTKLQVHQTHVQYGNAVYARKATKGQTKFAKMSFLRGQLEEVEVLKAWALEQRAMATIMWGHRFVVIPGMETAKSIGSAETAV
jgi:hypothetical protein